MSKEFQLALTCLAAFALLSIEHLVFTWWPALRGRVGPPWSYVLGVISLALPWAVLEISRGQGGVVWDLAWVAVAAGVPVIIGYARLDVHILRYENKLLKRWKGKDGRTDSW